MSLNVHAINQPEVMIGNAAEKFDASGRLTAEATRERIRELLQNLVHWTQRLRPRPGSLRPTVTASHVVEEPVHA